MTRRAFGIFGQHAGPESAESHMARNALGVCLTRAGRYQQAEAELTRALAGFEDLLGPLHWRVDTTKARLRQLYEAWGKPEQAALLRGSRPN